MSYKFETKDRFGNEVRLSESTYNSHLQYRSEMADYLDEARQTIEDPDLILCDKDGCHHHYKLGLGRGKFKNCYVQVLVRYKTVGGRTEGVVVSYWLARRVRTVRKGEKIVWMRPKLGRSC